MKSVDLQFTINLVIFPEINILLTHDHSANPVHLIDLKLLKSDLKSRNQNNLE